MGSDQKTLNALAKGAGVTAIGMMISKALSYLYRIVIARGVGPDAYGQLSLAIMVAGIGGTIAYLALGNGLQKFIPEFRTQNNNGKIKGAVLSVLGTTFFLSALMTAAVFFGAEFIALTFFDNPSLIPLLKIMSFTILLGNLSNTFFDTTIGFNKIIYHTATVRIIQNIVQLVATVVLLMLGYQVASAAWGWLTGAAIAAILGFYFMERKTGPIIFSNADAKYEHSKLLRFSSPLLLSGLIGTILGWADTAFLGYYMTDTEVGLYNAALPTAMLILLPHSAIGSLALSSFSELKERDGKSVEESLKTATRWVFSLVFPTFLILLLFSNQVLTLLFGPEYGKASMALSILACGYLISASVGRVGSFLQSRGHTQYILYNNTLALGLNLALNITLIPAYGLIGAAIATTSSTILTNALMFVEVWRKEKIISIPFKEIAKISLTGLLPFAAVMSLDYILFKNTPIWFLTPAVLLYYLLYTGLYLKALGIQEEEIEVLKSLKRKLLLLYTKTSDYELN